MDEYLPVLSTELCRGIASWFQQNTWFKNIFYPQFPLFKQIDDYYRIDFPQGDMTALSIHPLSSDTVTEPSKENGQISIDVSFSLGQQREYRGKQIYATVEAIRAQLLSNPTYIQTFLSTYYVPGLMMINGQNKIDYTRLNQQILSGAPTTTIPIVLNYKIGILLNQRALWKRGLDFYSPLNQLYYPIEEIQINLQTNPQVGLSAYQVSKIMGYSADGTLMIPSGNSPENGWILGNDGNIYLSWLISPLPPKTVLQFVYVPNTSDTYPEPGMLVLGENAVSGTGGLLLGDYGNVYNIVYDGSIFTDITANISSVVKSVQFPHSGTLLTKTNAVTGNSGVLFANNGYVYNLKLK